MVEIAVKVNPGSRNEELKVISQFELQVKIRARPVDGEANRDLIRFLSEKLKIPKSKITIRKGTSGRLKKILFDLAPEDWELTFRNLPSAQL